MRNAAIIKEITDLTLRMQREHPEMYKRLGEAPITLTTGEDDASATEELTDYRNTLREMLKKKDEAETG